MLRRCLNQSHRFVELNSIVGVALNPVPLESFSHVLKHNPQLSAAGGLYGNLHRGRLPSPYQCALLSGSSMLKTDGKGRVKTQPGHANVGAIVGCECRATTTASHTPHGRLIRPTSDPHWTRCVVCNTREGDLAKKQAVSRYR